MTNKLFSALAALTLLFSCSKPEPPRPGLPLPGEEGDHVFLYYAAGCSNLSGDIIRNIETMKRNYLPPGREEDNVVLLFATKYDSSRPHLIRLYRDDYNNAVTDTLMTYPPQTPAASAEILNEVLRDVRKLFPDRKYGMLVSSHGSGWIPNGYYGSPESTTAPDGGWSRPPMEFSIGYDKIGDKKYEIDIRDFAEAIPMRLDYILFDACFMGAVEVACQLKDVCGQIGFSQTEILAQGFNYVRLLESLLTRDGTPAENVCSDFFNYYNNCQGVEKSATISVVNTGGLDHLAEICRRLNDKYGRAIQDLDRTTVQRYFRSNPYYQWFYDLKDIYAKAGAGQHELTELDDALDGCITYKNATEFFMKGYNGFKIGTHCGLSMYLPGTSWKILNEHYKSLEWNKMTQLVK